MGQASWAKGFETFGKDEDGLMWGLILRFLPGLTPALGALFNPWMILILVGVVAGAFFYGLHIGNSRLDAFKTAVAAVGEAQEKLTKERIKREKRLKQEIDREHEKRVAVLSGRIVDLVKRLQHDPGGSVLPAPAPGTTGSQEACFDRPQLDRALRNFTSGAARLLGEGAEAVEDLNAAKGWIRAVEQ